MNLSVRSFVISGPPHPPKEKYFLLGPQHPPKVKYFLSAYLAEAAHIPEDKKRDAETVFKAFANSFEKSSSHWQTRDKYLSDIKQAKH